MSDIFGGSKEQSHSSNQAYPYLQGALSGTVGQGTSAGSQIANLLGLNGGGAQTDGFNQFRQSTGYQFGKDQGIQGIVGSQATKGLLNSGGTLKAIDQFGTDYANTKYQDYTSMLSGLLGQGLQGASILGNSGQVANASGSSTKGSGGFIGSLLSK